MDWWIGGLVDETHEFRCLNESSLSAIKLNDCSAEKDLSSALSSALRERIRVPEAILLRWALMAPFEQGLAQRRRARRETRLEK